ncbi:hypothetical protein [Sulfurimonas sp.]|uniref:hypothetical protein n=1 Tax=Sulfurimonas sp. TaxID=2022749 RepID=UPI0025D376F3|nr:hypothetical protein [Sulfurimonas sp.]
MIKYFYALLFIVIIFLFKPISTYFLEDYTSKLLEQKVKVTSISISELKVQAYISESNNTITATLQDLYPLKIKAYYSGDINAFKTYHPLKGYGKASANITYADALEVDGEVFLYGANAKVIVKELKKNWYVGVDATSLNLKTLQEQNSKEVKADALVDFDLELYTGANTSINLRTKFLDISQTQIKNIDIKLSLEKENFKLLSFFKLPDFYKMSLDADGIYKDRNISASTNITFKDVSLDIDSLKIDTKTMQTSLHTASLGGDLDASYKNGMLYLKTKALHLSKVLKAIGQKPLARGYLDLDAKLNTKSLDADLLLSSPWIEYDKQRVKDIKLSLAELKYRDKELNTTYKLSASFMKKLFTFDGDINFKDILKLNARSSDFKAQTQLHLEDDKYNLSLKNADIKELLEFASLKPYAKGLVDLDASGDFDKIKFSLKTDATMKEHNISANSEGSYTFKSKLLESNFKAFVPLEQDSFKVSGKASYKEHLLLNAYSSSFDSKTNFKLEDDNFKFYTHGIDMHKLASALKKPKTLFGLVDIQAEGKFDDIDFKIKSEELRRDMKLEDIDAYVSVNLNGHYTPKLLTLKDTFLMHYNKDTLALNFAAKVELEPPYKSKGSFTHNKDKIIVNSFSYEKEQIKSNFLIDINELYLYRVIMANNFHGPLKISANYTNTLNIISNSLGGELKAELNKSNLNINIKDVDAKKVAFLVAQGDILDRGILNGTANYNIKTQTAKTDISLSSAILNGVNIDEEISTFNDAMGLNIINMSESLISSFYAKNNNKTEIQQLEFDISLKNKIIKLDDVALRTQKFLLAALGNIKDNGNINSLDISIVDKNGCAIITQALKGNIKNPQTTQTTSTLVDIVQRVPESIFTTGKKAIDFSTELIDDIASFGAKNIFRNNEKVSITSDIVSGGFSIMNQTSNIIMPQGCSIIYNGKVKHPKNLIKDKK